jgi:hypothetical protein
VDVPTLNLETYAKLNLIENVLRELLIEELSRIAGPRWYQKRLPSDVLKNYRESMEFVRKVRWTRLIPHHPIYYTDFGDLRKIIERSDNWTEVFSSFFGRKEFLLTFLGELETIRNTTAHNRKNSDLDFQLVSSSLDQLQNVLRPERFEALSKRFTGLASVKEFLSQLQREGARAAEACLQCKLIDALPAWSNAQESWWFDDDYLGSALEPIRQYFGLVREYMSLPRSRGSGHHLEKWIGSSSMKEKFADSDSTLGKLLIAVP